MSLTSKRHQLAGEQREDRLSSLPSSLIGYILSFLPTKDVVATSVLSSKWRNFWTLVTRLCIDDYLLSSQDKSRTELLQAEFVDFMYRVLLAGRFPCIEAFRLRCSRSSNPYYVSAWLASVLKSNVQELDATVSFKDNEGYLVLPRCLFACRTLVKLKLIAAGAVRKGHFYMDVPGSVYFPCLKSVELAWVEFSDEDSITRFLSGCPVLDSLSLLKCIGENVKVVKTSVPSLTSLSLSYLHVKEGFPLGMVDGDVPTLRIVLDTPFLRKIRIQEYVPQGYVFENVHQLTSADINFTSRFDGSKWIAPFKDFHLVAAKDLLKGISKVRKLYLYSLPIDRRLDLPTFENLRDLDFGTHQKVKLEVLLKVLETTPVLSSLRIVLNPVHGTGEGNGDDDILELDGSQSVPNCLLLHLKTVEIVDLRRSNKVVELVVEYLLRNARVLERVTVKGGFKEEPRKASELLLTLPRASRACRLIFCNF